MFLIPWIVFRLRFAPLAATDQPICRFKSRISALLANSPRNALSSSLE
jgi:hypothetical protein